MDKKKKAAPLAFPNIFSRTDGRAGDTAPPADPPAADPTPGESPRAADPPRLSGRGRSATRARTTWPTESARLGEAAPAPGDGSPAGPRATASGGASAGNSPLASPGRFIMEGAAPRDEASPGRSPKPRPESPGPPEPALDAWMTRTLTQAHVCDTRRDRSGDTPLLKAARAADFVALVDMLGHPGTNIYFRDAHGHCAYDLLKKSAADHESPEFKVLSQALFLRTLLSLMIREERYAGLVVGAAAGATPRQLAERVYARLVATYHGQPADRALPFAALPSVDYIEATIRLM